HAVLPAFVLGLVMSRHYAQHREEQRRLRMVAFAFLTPFFFIKGGLNVSLGAVFSNLGLLAALLATKMLPKLAFIYPLARRAVPPPGDVHDAPDEHRADVRDDLVALRAHGTHHRQDPVLAVDHRRRALGGRADGDRGTVVPP